MEIRNATEQDKIFWNNFVRDNYPPVGAFMQTWEWGDFKIARGKKVGRFILESEGGPLAVFMLVEHRLPGGFSYGYIPRGPVFREEKNAPDFIIELLTFIRSWLVKNFSHFIFVRLEPPFSLSQIDWSKYGFARTSYYVQPRYNHLIDLGPDDTDIIDNFHPSARSNIRRGEKRGVRIELQNHRLGDHYHNFQAVAKDTVSRNSGAHIYPSEKYFSALLSSIEPITLQDGSQPDGLAMGVFYGYHGDEVAAIHFVLFFGHTATYLYGASSTEHLSSKVTTCLHYSAMQEAKRRGLHYYDLGGVDDKLWPTLTKFKRQFRGSDIEYVGNLDIVMSPTLYRIYDYLKRLRR